jgi:hypothetical protein
MPACALLHADCKATIKVWDQCGGKSNCLGSDCEGVSAQHTADQTVQAKHLLLSVLVLPQHYNTSVVVAALLAAEMSA